ncbi:MAG TPA: PAS domain-containing sensor histidine kinase [Lunatimonas sp.]|nr:PAS domain-containing sensor histidine kinase [Lunatimonas sp.]
MPDVKKKLGFPFFILGLLLILIIFIILPYFRRDQQVWSLPYFLIVFYLLWIGNRGIYHYILGILTSLAIAIDYSRSIDLIKARIFDFSEGLVIILTVWIVIYFNYEQKQGTNRERKVKERLSAIFENTTEGILVINQEGQIIMVNRCAEELFGYSKIELMGKKVESLIPERFTTKHAIDREKYNHLPHQRTKKAGKEFYALHKDNYEFPVEVSLGYFKTEEEVTAIAFVTDISERKKAESQLLKEKEHTHKLNEELEFRVKERMRDLEEVLKSLEENNKSLKLMEVKLIRALERERELGELKSRFVTMASHEFRTPLSTILSSVFLLENYSDEQLEQSKRTHFKRIRRSINNMTTILNEFLSLSKLEEGRVVASYSEINIPLSIQEILEEVESVKKADQQIHYTHESTLDTYYIDPQFLRNILINLLSNAFKFSSSSDTIELISKIDAEQLVIIVTDHGIGIPEQEQKYLFNRFFRAKNAQNIEGTGLGLNIVKKYVDLMKGAVSVESRLNQGTTFIVVIPSNPPISDFQKQV